MAISFIENDKNDFDRPLGQVKSVISLSEGLLKKTAISLARAIELYMEGNMEASDDEAENALTLYDMLPKDEKLYDTLYELLMTIYELKVKLYVDRDPKKALEYLDVISRQINTPKKTSTTEKLDSRYSISSYYYMGLAHKNMDDMDKARASYIAGIGMLKLLIPEDKIVDLDMCLRLYYVTGKAFMGEDDDGSILLFNKALNLFRMFYKDPRKKIVTKDTLKLCIVNAEALLEMYKKRNDTVSMSSLKEDIDVLYKYLKDSNEKPATAEVRDYEKMKDFHNIPVLAEGGYFSWSYDYGIQKFNLPILKAPEIFIPHYKGIDVVLVVNMNHENDPKAAAIPMVVVGIKEIRNRISKMTEIDERAKKDILKKYENTEDDKVVIGMSKENNAVTDYTRKYLYGAGELIVYWDKKAVINFMRNNHFI